MDDPEERPVSDPESGTPADGEEEEADSNDVALAIVFGTVGLSLFLTLDTPWAGLPMVVLGLFFGYRAVRRALRPSDEPGTTASRE